MNSSGRVDAPKIVNIVNFIRQNEPRIPEYTNDVLYQTVVQQVKLLQQYKLPGTFLLQYDALMDGRYQSLLKELDPEQFEIGAWWELPQPLIEKAGLVWRGQFSWDWHAHVGFTTGYTPEEREKIADVYMEDFKQIFGYYPESVASWFIDAHTLHYLSEKYGIVASANCKDQMGTDGYTLWGGYWNQAYYPSKSNAYMPAQNKESQITVPIFRMLGSDPIRQYDFDLGKSSQRVVSIEPVNPDSGGKPAWINWFMNQFVDGESIAFNYVQIGQENSFTWERMKEGYLYQIPLIAQLRDENRVKVETLAQSGKWFRKNFAVTPATSFTANEDYDGGNQKTVWFNSRYYRTNLLWEGSHLRIRDIHLFDEKFASIYETEKTLKNEAHFYTLPFVDGFHWSDLSRLSGIRFYTMKEGKVELVEGGTPEIKSQDEGVLTIRWPLLNQEGAFELVLTEKDMLISLVNSSLSDWFLELSVKEGASLPFQTIEEKKVSAAFEGMAYQVHSKKGTFRKAADNTFKIYPEKSSILIDFSVR